MTTKHTKGPYAATRVKLTDYKGNTGYNVFVDSFRVGGYTGALDLDNDTEKQAAFIVLACNSHYELLGALKSVVDAHKTGDFYDRGRKVHDLIDSIAAAIAKARGEA